MLQNGITVDLNKYSGDLALFFKAFGDNTRIRILCFLLEGEHCVQEISDELSLTQSAVSHQLSLLKNVRLVKSRREGKNIIYSLDDDHVETILRQGLTHIAHR